MSSGQVQMIHESRFLKKVKKIVLIVSITNKTGRYTSNYRISLGKNDYSL